MSFAEKAELVKTLKKDPTNEEKLELYGLYKQATVGDCNTDRPGLFDPKGKAKWDAWNNRKGLSTADAEQKYIEVVDKLVTAYGV